MAIPYVYLRWWIGIFCGLIFLLEVMAPMEYVFGHLYIIPILLTACELSGKGIATAKIISATSKVTIISVLLTLVNFVFLEVIDIYLLNFREFPIATLFNRLNVVIVLLLTDWLIKSSLIYMEKISCQKEEIARHKAELSAQIRLDRIHKDFVYTLTHDLKTPLLGAIQIIKYFQQEKFGAVSSTQSKVLSTMSRSHKLSLDLVEMLLDVYRNDAEGFILHRQQLDLQSIARESIDSMVALGLERHIKFNLNFEGLETERSELTGDRLQLSRVFNNLLSNAIYHSPRGGQIDVYIYYQEDRYIVSISDRGDDISPSDLPFLFDRFYQAQGKLKGSGLGLYLSRQIVEAHGGSIWVETRLPQGAKFYFSLPIEI
jgi:two-component system, NarL family, sensor kinase